MTPHPTSDPIEAELRAEWYERKSEWENAGRPDSGPTTQGFTSITKKLSDYLWQRVLNDIAEDRRKHPKAKRNQKYEGGATGAGRVLP